MKADTLTSLQQQLAALQSGGLDATRLVTCAHLQALLHRAAQQRPAVAEQLLRRASKILAELRDELAATAASAVPPLRESPRQPAAGRDKLQGLVRQLTAHETRPDGAASGMELDDYLRQRELELLGQTAAEGEPADAVQPQRPTAPVMELRAARRLRQTLAAEHTANLLHRAIEESPESPGPLNPQMLATRALTSMRQLSPQYFNRFVSYIDALLYIEQCGKPLAAARRKTSGKKRKRATPAARPKG